MRLMILLALLVPATLAAQPALRGKRTRLNDVLSVVTGRSEVAIEHTERELFRSQHASARVNARHIDPDSGAELLLLELRSRDSSCPYDYRLVELGPRSTGRIRWTGEFGNCGKVSKVEWGARSRFRFDEWEDSSGKKTAVKFVTYDIDDGSISY